ncbi:MAG: hypothetical protein HFJ48_03970 [Clostridia bacterium]|nr:hypothetical protein [Clostridia bacterium]
MLKNVLLKKENNQLAKELFSKILKLNIKELEFEKIVDIDNISDYEFGMAKLNTTIEENGQIGEAKVYAKIIRYDKIKESIFCYWTLIYEEEFKDRPDIEMSNIIQKVSIDELPLEEEHKKSVFLNIQNNNSGILQYGTEIHFLEFKNYINEYGNKDNNLKEWNEYLELKDEEILLVSVIYTDKVHR